jgi:hypothetical protein
VTVTVTIALALALTVTSLALTVQFSRFEQLAAILVPVVYTQNIIVSVQEASGNERFDELCCVVFPHCCFCELLCIKFR